jgi:guanyl-specific ribonuclease Sa
MLIPSSAIEKSSNFLSGKELVKKDALDPDAIGEIVGFKITTGNKWKDPKSTEPDVKETKYQLSLNVNTLGEKILELNKTNLEAIVTKWGTKTSEGYSINETDMVGKLIILQAKLENNGKHSVLIVFSDRLNASQMATTPLAQIKPIVAQQATPIANTANLDSEIVALLDSIAFMSNFPVLHNGVQIGDKRDELPKKDITWKQMYKSILVEIQNELLAEIERSRKPNLSDFS